MKIDLTAVIDDINELYRTHMDVFYGGEQAGLDSLVTDCVMLDIRKSPKRVDLENLEYLEDIKKGDTVILRTGWEVHRGTPKYDKSPWIDKMLIRKLVDIGVVSVLVDSPGVFGGVGGKEHNKMDKFLADHKAYAIENVVNLAKLTTQKFKLYCFPIYSETVNAAPCRIIAEEY